MTWVKGKSGNPSGLAKNPTLASENADNRELRVIRKRMLQIIKSGPENAAVAASKELLDRIEGKVAARKDAGTSIDNSTAKRLAELTERLLLRHTVTPPDQPTDSTPLSTTA